MFEDRTSETLLEEMLDDVSDEFDKREESPIFMSLSPLSKKLADCYVALDRVLELGFASTSEDEYLENRVSESGVKKKEPVYTVRKGIFNIPLELGTRFFVDDIYYYVSEVGDDIKLTCEEAGEIGNKPSSGSVLLPLDNIDNLEVAELGEILIKGEEQEADKSLFKRFQEKVSEPATSGNDNHYKQWAKEVSGIERARVFPRWQGKGTVRVVVVRSDGRAPTSNKVKEVFDYIETNRPFDAEVTVNAAIEVPINITADVSLQAGTDKELVEGNYLSDVTEEFIKMAFNSNLVRYSQLSSMILDQPGSIDYQNVKINGKTSNIVLAADEIAVPGLVTFNVV
ncbi:baseplate J/gp47 family protein [Heyndrickxia sp. NPDC080065]|uniref:baseplate J/gp47 family protein n=1 Tax=Heyndrickxia sp. NPDC080065 TaxID=3390568 RepID=UPI003D04BDB3